MALTTTRTPRGSVIIRANECQNPRLGSTAGWFSTSNPYGTGGAGTDSFTAPTLVRSWTTAPSNADGAGFYYRHTGWGAGATKVASIDVYVNGFEPKMGWRFYHYNASGTLVGSSTSSTPVQTVKNTTQRISGSATAPAGTAYTDCVFCITPGNYPQANHAFAIQRCLIEPGTTVSPYFDGTTYASGNGTQFTTWEGTADGSRSLLWDVNPITAVAPTLVLGYDVTQQSRNVVHQLIDGGVAAAQLPATLRSGTLRLFFPDATSAENARIAHAGAGYWSFLDTDQPQEAMVYVVNGPLRKVQDEQRRRWTLEIPYAEIST